MKATWSWGRPGRSRYQESVCWFYCIWSDVSIGKGEVRSGAQRSRGADQSRFFIRKSSLCCGCRCSRVPPLSPEGPWSCWKLHVIMRRIKKKRKDTHNAHALCNNSRAVTVCDLRSWTPLTPPCEPAWMMSCFKDEDHSITCEKGEVISTGLTQDTNHNQVLINKYIF